MKSLRTMILLSALLGTLPLAAAADVTGPGPYTLELGSWVCKTPALHDEVVAQQNQGTSPFKLAKTMFDEGKCLYVDDEILEDMMQPFVGILERQNGRTKVSFFIEFYKKYSELRNSIRLVKFTGWTADENVKKHIKAD